MRLLSTILFFVIGDMVLIVSGAVIFVGIVGALKKGLVRTCLLHPGRWLLHPGRWLRYPGPWPLEHFVPAAELEEAHVSIPL